MTRVATIPAPGGNPRRREADRATQDNKEVCAKMEQDTLRVEVPRPRRMEELRAVSSRHPGDASTQLDFDCCVLAMIRACGACGEAADEASQEIRLFADLWYNGLRDQAAAHARLSVEHLRTLQRDSRRRRAIMRLAREARAYGEDIFKDESPCSVAEPPGPLVENRACPEVEKALAESNPAPVRAATRSWLVRLGTRQRVAAGSAEQAVETARAEAPAHIVFARAVELEEDEA